VASEVREMVSDEEVVSTFHVMCQLRPHLGEEGYVERIRGVRQGGYRLAAVVDEGQVRCVAGFRIQDYLYCGKHLYVDDLVTDEGSRSKSYGKLMLDWLIGEAKRNGCEQFHLDSGVQRHDTHRFYFREGMKISSYHFSKTL
jgi:GNAT superfamily N-acetyltransferase